MPSYKYVARDERGARARGVVEGESAEDAARRLVAGGLYPSRITKRLTAGRGALFGLRRRVSPRDRIMFISRLAVLLGAGVPIISSLEILRDQEGNETLRKALADIRARVGEGEALSAAMSRHGDIFSDAQRAIVAAGESSGRLESCLERLALSLERDLEAAERAREAVRYPKIVLLAATVAAAVLLAFVVPRFALVFERIEAPLPFPTEALIAVSGAVTRGWPWAAAVAVLGWGVFRSLASMEGAAAMADRMLLRAPSLGSIIMYLAMARWANALGDLLGAGAPLIESLELSAGAAGNAHIAASMRKTALRVAEGAGFSESLRAAGAPPVAVRMIEAGEASGALDEMLYRTRDYFEKEAGRKIRSLVAWMEPALVVSLGLLVLFIALAVFLPMWDMTRMAGGGL
ncbi:MAG: type II secretion system F family protein [Candidatus Nitrospinota bacterium M3_3B_026]